MPEITADSLARLTTHALERTAFMLVDPADSADPAQLTRHARIGYTGDAGAGDVFISASEGFALELASSLLGCEPDEIDVEEQGVDAVRELANILAGCVLTSIGGEEHAFRLGLPETANANPEPGGGVACAMDSMGEPLVVSWQPRHAA
ncbi:MAG: chemotaxis protein CheX [Planctomycetota bacterium]